MKFLNYISEAAEYNNETEDLIKTIVPAIKNNSKLYKLPVIWRGWQAAKSDIFAYAEITGADKRDFIRGMSGLPAAFSQGQGFRDWVGDVVKSLGFNPICCSYDYNAASFFGNPCIVVPESNFKIYQNPSIWDLATKNPSSRDEGGVHITTFKYEDEEVEKVVKGYKEDYTDNKAELLLKCNKYYLINVRRMMWLAKNSKFKKINEIKELKTYNQVIDFIYNYKSYMDFIKKRKPQW